MEFKQIIDMVNILVAMSADTYLKCKCAILAVCKNYESQYFFAKLFGVADKRRPKLLEMKQHPSTPSGNGAATPKLGGRRG